MLFKENTNALKGFGIFISQIFFLTVAQALLELEVDGNGNFVEVCPNYLKIRTGKNTHNVLRYKRHEGHLLKYYFNNIAVVMVSSYINNSKVLTK